MCALFDDTAAVEHDQLLAQGGAYAALWRRQSGGFRIDLPRDMPGRERETIGV